MTLPQRSSVRLQEEKSFCKGFMNISATFRLVYHLLRIPRLFASLLLFPLILGIVLVYGQIVFTGLMVTALRQDADALESKHEAQKDNYWVRQVLYGSGRELQPIKVCRWHETQYEGVAVEQPPSEDCMPDRFDVAIRSSDPAHFDASLYQKTFDGNVERLHICKTCSPDTVIYPELEHPRSDLKTVWSLLNLTLLDKNDEIRQKYLDAFKNAEAVRDSLGTIYFHPSGMTRAVKLTGSQIVIALILSITSVIIISLWLALKAHRKVLDYFAKSSALLPIVAATGRGTFYSAVWLLTLLRVAAFLLAAVPIMFFNLGTLVQESEISLFEEIGGYGIGLWLISLTASLALATVIASIAELKHRSTLLSFGYKFVPLVLCFVGAIVWLGSFIFDGSVAGLLRSAATAMPIVGTTPILVAPLFTPRIDVLMVHTVLSVLLIIWISKKNARWFAAHLEEL